MRTLHCVSDDDDDIVVDVDVEDDVEDDGVDDDVDADRSEVLVLTPGVVVVGLEAVVVVSRDLVEGEGVDVVVEAVSGVAVAREGGTATGVSPTCESASPTICQVSIVATTRAVTQAAAMRQEIMC